MDKTVEQSKERTEWGTDCVVCIDKEKVLTASLLAKTSGGGGG